MNYGWILLPLSILIAILSVLVIGAMILFHIPKFIIWIKKLITKPKKVKK